MSKVQNALARHMGTTGTSTETISELLVSDERTLVLLSGESGATLYEATLLAAYFKTSVREFIDPIE